MRTALALFLLASPAAAWEFSASPICTLTNTTAEGIITVTYDPALPEYAISVTLPDSIWPTAPVFGMAFAADRPISNQTDRHRITNAGRTITVTNQGFGNVLNGLEFNSRVYAIIGDTTVGFSLDGIGDAMTAFRNCPAMNMT